MAPEELWPALPPPSAPRGQAAKRDARPSKAVFDPKMTPDAKRSQASTSNDGSDDAPPSPARDFAREERAMLQDAGVSLAVSYAARAQGRGAPRQPSFGRGRGNAGGSSDDRPAA